MAQVKALLDRQTQSPWQLLHWSEEVVCSFLRHPSSHTQTPTHCIEWTSLVNLSSGSWLVPYELFCMCAQHMHTIPKYHSPFTPAAKALSLPFSPHGSRWHTHFLFPCTHTHTHLPVGFEVTLTLTVWARVGFFSLRQVKLAVCQEFFSLFFFSACLSTHSLFLCRCSVQWPATSFLFPVSVHTYLHTVSFLCQPLCAAWRLNSSQWVDLSSLPVCVYVHLSRLQYSYGDEKYSFRGGGWVLTSSDRNVIFCSLCSDSSWAQIVNIFTFPLLPICAIVGQNQEFCWDVSVNGNW